MTEQIVLYGAGTVGRFLARELASRGTPPIRFADNDRTKQFTRIEGVFVESPDDCLRAFPDATWIATALHTPYPAEIKSEIQRMGVKSEPLTKYISTDRPSIDGQILEEVLKLCADYESRIEMFAQDEFRRTGRTLTKYNDVKDVYFPDFIRKLDDEIFIDCGGADGDTAEEVLKRWLSPTIISFEPDQKNHAAFWNKHLPVDLRWAAVSDYTGTIPFTITGDQTAHVGGDDDHIPVVKLDDVLSAATFIKMDIEGCELEGLWGARKLIAQHSPVLAICAYHLPDHIWQIPLLIHALNPHYKLFLRRYLEMPWEMVWYAVPPDRVI